MIYIETDRLILRDYKDSDLPIYQEMNKNFNVRRFFPDVLSDERSQLAFEHTRDILQRDGIGLFAVEEKSSGAFIGFVGLQYLVPYTKFDLDIMPCYEVGWRLHEPFWHQGYATEAAGAVLEYAKQKGINRIYSFTTKINLPSIRVMEKIQLKYIKDFMHPLVDEASLKLHVLYGGELQ